MDKYVFNAKRMWKTTADPETDPQQYAREELRDLVAIFDRAAKEICRPDMSLQDTIAQRRFNNISNRLTRLHRTMDEEGIYDYAGDARYFSTHPDFTPEEHRAYAHLANRLDAILKAISTD